jgi:hypothetical protein
VGRHRSGRAHLQRRQELPVHAARPGPRPQDDRLGH